MTLPRVPAGWLHEIASGLKITQLVGGATSKWKPNMEQIAVWKAGEVHQRRYITKSRRRGISTALDLEDAVWTKWMDELGHRVRTGVVLHREDNLAERMFQMANFLEQMYGVSKKEHDASTFSITMPGKSEIFGITAGSSDSSRSEGAQRMRYEEYAFYRGGIGSIAPSVSLGAQETICTTIDISAPNGITARDVWRDTTNNYAKIFFPFEDAREYRDDPAKISEEQWAWAQKNNFTRRDSAAYWLTETVPNKCEGDIIRAFREYPIVEDDMFRAGEAKWVRKTPRVLPPIEVVGVLGVAGDVWPLLIYRRPEDTSGRIVFAADSAKGTGISRSTVVGVEDDGRMVACFSDNTIMGDDHARVAKKALELYTRDRNGRREVPILYAEDNTTGQIFIQPARRIGLPVETFDTDEASQLVGMTEAKRAIELGLLEGPKELAQECDECFRDPLTGKWKGHKDILMTYGMCRRKDVRRKFGPPEDKNDENKIRGKKMLRAAMARQRMGMW